MNQRPKLAKTGTPTTKETPDSSKSAHRRRRRKPAAAKTGVMEPEPTLSTTHEPEPVTEPLLFIYTYTIWNRFPSGRDN